jgi:FecR protein
MVPRQRLSWAVCALAALTAVVLCAIPLAAQDFGGAAKVLVRTGRVSILRDNYEVAVDAGTVIQPKQIIFTGPDGYAKLELSDGSTFEIFQNSKAIFRPSGSLWDLLDVWLGHVKVYIQHKNGPNNNRVTTQTAIISVRGTVFDVNAEDEDTTFVSVDEGVVSVRHARLPGNEVLLQAGQSMRVYKDQPLARNSIDKGSAARAALRVAAQAVYDTLARRNAGGMGTGVPTGGTTAGGTAQGDKGKGGSGTGNGAPPPPPPPPPN